MTEKDEIFIDENPIYIKDLPIHDGQDTTDGAVAYEVFPAVIRTTKRRGEGHSHHHCFYSPNSNVSRTFELRDGDEVWCIRYKETCYDVTAWTHHTLLHVLKHMPLVEEDSITLIIRRFNSDGSYDLKEVIISIVEMDFGDKADRFLQIVVEGFKYHGTSEGVEDVQYKGVERIFIRHGALSGHFLTKSDTGQPIMDVKVGNGPETKDNYTFNRYAFTGLSNTGRYVYMCCLQHAESEQFLFVDFKLNLSFVKDTSFHGDSEMCLKPNPRFFYIHDHNSMVYFESMVFRDYFIKFDAVGKLHMQKCIPAPWDEDCMDTGRNFSFDMIPFSSP